MKMKEIFSKLDSDDMACAILFLTDLTIHILNYSISHEATSGGNVLQVIVIPIEGPQGEEDISDDDEDINDNHETEFGRKDDDHRDNDSDGDGDSTNEHDDETIDLLD